MTPTVRKATGNAAVVLLLAGVATAAGLVWRRYGRLDPYAKIEKAKRPYDPSSAIQATGVKLRHYENGKLVAQSDADRITIGQDRNRIVMKGVRNGVAQTPQGPMQFAGRTGVLNPLTKTIEVSGGVRVQGKAGADFDVQTGRATLDGRLGQVTVPTPLKGTIMGGQFTADSMVRRMNANSTHLKNPEWKGRLPKGMEIPAAAQNRVWDMASDSSDIKGTLTTHTNARANDGEVIVTAPTIVQNTKTNVITATKTGDVRATYRSAKADIIADKVVVYRDDHKAVCTGHVLMFVRPKKDWDKPLPKDDDAKGPMVPEIPKELLAKSAGAAALSEEDKARVDELRSGKNLRDVPMSLAADEVTYWYKEGERRAIAKEGNPTALQRFDDGRWRQVWAPEAHYDGEKDMLDLVGDKTKRQVRMKNSVGDDFDAFAATVSTKEEETEDTQSAHLVSARGHVFDFTDDVPRAKPAADPKRPTPPAKGAGNG